MRLKVIFALIFAYIIYTLSACATGQQTDRPYQEIGRSAHFTLPTDGLIIGFEKRSVNSEEKKENLLGEYRDIPLYGNLVEPISGDSEIINERNNFFRRYAYENSKIMMPTQIVSKIDGVQKFEYNAYDKKLDGEYSYTKSYKKLAGVFRKLRDEGDVSKKYSHIIVLNMGWNNDQTEAMWRYKLIVEGLSAAAKNHKPEFKPFVIAVTWPSVWRSISDFKLSKWFFHLISYPNKTLDADELGITWMNWIVNDQIPSLMDKRSERRQKLVLIGHSLGARILSRAVFSSEHLLEAKESDNVDLMVGLQAAFSATRFVEGAGLEAHPFAEFGGKHTKLVYTTSTKDTANPLANYVTGAKHIGGKKGQNYVKKHVEKARKNGKEPVYKIVNWPEVADQIPVYDNKVLLVDASSIVTGVEETDTNPKLSAHNDILDKPMAELIWHYIKHL